MKMVQWFSGRLYQLSSEVSSEVSSQISSSTEPGAWIPKFLQDDWSRIRVGLVLWVAAIVIVVTVVAVLLLSRKGQGNNMPSGRVYAQRREMKSHPHHLLDDKYYRDPQNREKK